MLIAIVLDWPLPEAQALVDQPREFLQEITRVLENQKTHPILEQMLQTIQGDSTKDASSSANSARRHQSTDDNEPVPVANSAEADNHQGVPLAGFRLCFSLG